jgi:hypothetical protein
MKKLPVLVLAALLLSPLGISAQEKKYDLSHHVSEIKQLDITNDDFSDLLPLKRKLEMPES